jgi:hypothetical protein
VYPSFFEVVRSTLPVVEMSNGVAMLGSVVAESPESDLHSDTESVRSFNGLLDEKDNRWCGSARVWRTRFLGRRIGVLASGVLFCVTIGVLLVSPCCCTPIPMKLTKYIAYG